MCWLVTALENKFNPTTSIKDLHKYNTYTYIYTRTLVNAAFNLKSVGVGVFFRFVRVVRVLLTHCHSTVWTAQESSQRVSEWQILLLLISVSAAIVVVALCMAGILCARVVKGQWWISISAPWSTLSQALPKFFFYNATIRITTAHTINIRHAGCVFGDIHYITYWNV